VPAACGTDCQRRRRCSACDPPGGGASQKRCRSTAGPQGDFAFFAGKDGVGRRRSKTGDAILAAAGYSGVPVNPEGSTSNRRSRSCAEEARPIPSTKSKRTSNLYAAPLRNPYSTGARAAVLPQFYTTDLNRGVRSDQRGLLDLRCRDDSRVLNSRSGAYSTRNRFRHFFSICVFAS